MRQDFSITEELLKLNKQSSQVRRESRFQECLLSDLRSLQASLKSFRDNDIYKVLVNEYGDSKNQLVDAVCDAQPESLGMLVGREQAIGALSMVKKLLSWTDDFESELSQEIEVKQQQADKQ